MKKRVLVLVMAMTMGLSMVACGQKNDDFYNTTSDCGVDLDCDDDGEVDDGLASENPREDTSVSSEVYEINVSLMDDPEEVFKTLTDNWGDPYIEDSGDYKIATFDTLKITYSEVDGKKELIEFDVYSDCYTTNKGITIASTQDDVRAAYGEPLCEYDEGDEHHMNYFFEDGFSIYFTTSSKAGDAVTMYQIVMGRG